MIVIFFNPFEQHVYEWWMKCKNISEARIQIVFFDFYKSFYIDLRELGGPD